MAQISITATAGELLQFANHVKLAVCDLPENRSVTVTLDNAPGGSSKWAGTDPKGNVKKG